MEENVGDEENKENEPIEVRSDVDVHKQFLVEVPAEAISREQAVVETSKALVVEPATTTEDTAETIVEPPATAEATAETTVEPPATDIEETVVEPSSHAEGESRVVIDSSLLARSASKTEDGKWQSVDTSYIDWRTQDTNNLASRQIGGSSTNHADTISTGTAKTEDGKWAVNTSYIKDRTADTSNLDSRKKQSGIGSVASTATKKNSGGKWEVDTSYINYRTGDAALMRNKESSDKLVYEDPAEKQYSYEEITSDKRPAGVDPTKKEAYLSDAEFQTVMGCSKAEFSQMPKWKQQNLKKSKKLF
mmetsp:Transcript_79841/g.124511  ORF Transcript_79841/g.124511 Transcript_79841/m.124511 type:complete len:305 (+) Transcript_79841:55-969(+)